MRTGFTRLTGVVILIGAIFGLALSVYGLFALWASKEQVSGGVIELFALTARTVNATDKMLVVVGSSLEQASGDMALIRDILGDTAGTIGESTSLVDTTASLMGEDMPAFIQNTQTSLDSVQTTARLIDDMLGTITRIPLLGPFLGRRYSPEVPLGTSVANVSRSLDPLPATFTAIQRDMQVASASLATVQGEVEALSRQIADIDTTISEATVVVDEYQLILTDLNERLARVQTRLPALLDTGYLALTVILIWIGISQLGALLHAAELLRPNPRIR